MTKSVKLELAKKSFRDNNFYLFNGLTDYNYVLIKQEQCLAINSGNESNFKRKLLISACDSNWSNNYYDVMLMIIY